MANCIARAQGYTRNGPKAGEATRLGSEYVRAEANTWNTFATVTTNKDGLVTVVIKRNGRTLIELQTNRETEAVPRVNISTMVRTPYVSRRIIALSPRD